MKKENVLAFLLLWRPLSCQLTHDKSYEDPKKKKAFSMSWVFVDKHVCLTNREQIVWENSDNKWMKVPSIDSTKTKYLTF